MLQSHLLLPLALFLCVLIPTATPADLCPCGFSVTSANATDLYTDVIETDFLHLSSIRPNPCWSPQVYDVSAKVSRGPFGKRAVLTNVVANPIKSSKLWKGEGVKGGDAGLQLWVNSVVDEGLVGMGEIVSKRKDVFYGSLRVGLKVSRVAGTCSGWFWYHDDAQEIDMELLSSNANATSNPIYLVMQSPESAQHGFNALDTSTYEVAQLPFPADANTANATAAANGDHGSVSSTLHEYRFDWTPAGVRYYADSKILDTLVHRYAPSNGSLFLNHWSNGNMLWSRGPPTQNAVVTVSYIKAYFNTSDPARGPVFEAACAAAKVDNKNVCVVPDYIPIDGDDERSHFFAHGMCGENRDGGAGTDGSSSASKIGDGGRGTLKMSGGGKYRPSCVHVLYGVAMVIKILWW